MYTTDPKIKEYGPIPEATEFQNGYSFEKPVEVHGWEWSCTFNEWRALVTFRNGWKGFTSPKTW